MKLTILTSLAVLAVASASSAAPLQSATVTRVINDVKIYRPGTSAAQASIGSVIQGRSSLQTGRESRSELRFQDNTLTRVGQNSVFSFQQGSRDLELEQGTILLQVPKRAGGARIRTATVTAAITGTTTMIEYHRGKWAKIIVLEGSLEFFLNKIGRRVKVGPGQMLVLRADATKVPQPVDVDIKRLKETSLLAGDKLFGALPGEALTLINKTIARQDELIKTGTLSNPGTNPGTNPALGGHATSPAQQAAQTQQIVTDTLRTPEREAKWWEYRPRPGE